jgi:hypothetical protein
MKKKFFLNFSPLLKRLMVALGIGEIIMLMLITGGCGKSVYIAPDNEVTTQIILVNNIYPSGFYVEVDGKDAGFLQDELDIRVKPGSHKLKIFNKETSLSLLQENQITTNHKFSLDVNLTEGEFKQIELSWEDKGYSKNTERKVYQGDKKKDEIQKRREGERPRSGMPESGNPF